MYVGQIVDRAITDVISDLGQVKTVYNYVGQIVNRAATDVVSDLKK